MLGAWPLSEVVGSGPEVPQRVQGQSPGRGTRAKVPEAKESYITVQIFSLACKLLRIV